MLSAFEEACSYLGDDAKCALVVKDAMESVCLIKKDGLDNVFSHRSFQEYFSAIFIKNYRENNIGELIEALALTERQSNSLKMLYEISPDIVEYEWVLPRLESFLEKYGSMDFKISANLDLAFQHFADEYNVDPDTGIIRSYSVLGFTKDGTSDFAWLSTLSHITGSKLWLHKHVFLTSIWGDFETFLKSLPKSLQRSASSLKSRSEEHYDEAIQEDVEVYVLKKDDISWLLHSRFPVIFEEIILSARDLHRSIIERQRLRKERVSYLLKPKSQLPF